MNQVSLSFYPPRWKERLTPHPRSLNDQGKPVLIADAVPVEDAEQQAVSSDDFREWLTQQGFTAVDWGHGSVYYRGQVRSVFGVEKEIGVGLSDEAGELTSADCRLTLSRETPTALSGWAAFAAAMCAKFRLRLAPEGTTPCSEAEFLAAVKKARILARVRQVVRLGRLAAEQSVAPDRAAIFVFARHHAIAGGPAGERSR